jgi:hypothetical protein
MQTIVPPNAMRHNGIELRLCFDKTRLVSPPIYSGGSHTVPGTKRGRHLWQ